MKTPAKQLTIGITGLNAHDNPGPGVAVIRCLREYFGDTVSITGLAYESLEPGIYMQQLVDKVFRIPYPMQGATALLERLEFIKDEAGLDIVIPNFDAELNNFIKISPALAQKGIKTFLPTKEQLQARDKTQLAAFAEKYDFKVPSSILINKVDELEEAFEVLNYPLVLKGKYYEARIVDNNEEAQKAFYALSAKWGLPVIAQQFVKGTEINVAGLGDGDGNTLSVIPMRKLYITDKGKAWAGITIEDDALVQLAHRFSGAIKWRGGFELEVMKSDKGDLYIMEINPRFPAWIYLSAAAGQNQPAMLVNMINAGSGEPGEPLTEYASGKIFIRHSWDEVVDITKFQQFTAFGKL